MRARWSLALAAAAAMLLPAHAQTPGSALAAGSGSSGVLTATVIYGAHTHEDAGAGTLLDLLVLVRGATGWYAQTPRGASVLTGAASGTSDGRTTANYWLNGGGVTVTFATDSSLPTVHLTIAAGNATLVDQQVAPERENVVLVDGVGIEQAAGNAPTPKITTLHVDPRLPGEGSIAARAVRRTRSLVDFVQCGTTLPDSIPDEQGPFGRSLRNLIARSCGEIAGAR